MVTIVHGRTRRRVRRNALEDNPESAESKSPDRDLLRGPAELTKPVRTMKTLIQGTPRKGRLRIGSWNQRIGVPADGSVPRA